MKISLKKKGIPAPKEKHPYRWIVDKVKEAHWQIKEYLFSDKGVDLQNIDSHIMNEILMRLMSKGILGLSLYDSVIVAKQHKDILEETMINEYEKFLGFKPILD